jgi:Flp pilus assembly pilin Flp
VFRALPALKRLISNLQPATVRPTPPPGLLRDEGGAVYVEYIVLTLFVGIGFSAAVMAIGVPMLEMFRMTQVFLAAPLP